MCERAEGDGRRVCDVTMTNISFALAVENEKSKSYLSKCIVYLLNLDLLTMSAQLSTQNVCAEYFHVMCV